MVNKHLISLEIIQMGGMSSTEVINDGFSEPDAFAFLILKLPLLA